MSSTNHVAVEKIHYVVPNNGEDTVLQFMVKTTDFIS